MIEATNFCNLWSKKCCSFSSEVSADDISLDGTMHWLIIYERDYISIYVVVTMETVV